MPTATPAASSDPASLAEVPERLGLRCMLRLPPRLARATGPRRTGSRGSGRTLSQPIRLPQPGFIPEGRSVAVATAATTAVTAADCHRPDVRGRWLPGGGRGL